MNREICKILPRPLVLAFWDCYCSDKYYKGQFIQWLDGSGYLWSSYTIERIQEFLSEMTRKFQQLGERKVARIVVRFPFQKSMMKYVDSDDFMIRIGCMLLVKNAMRKFVRMMVQWYRNTILKKGMIHIHNKKENIVYPSLEMHYNPKYDGFWEAAFSGRVGGQVGHYNVFVNRDKISFESVKVFVEYKNTRQNMELKRHIEEASTDGMRFGTVFQEMCTIADRWDDPKLMEMLTTYLDKYMEETLCNNRLQSAKRIETFIQRKPIVAQYIWTTNMEATKTRERIAFQLGISNRNRNLFVKSETIEEMGQHLVKRQKSSHYDGLPEDMKIKITRAENDVKKAKEGMRVGLRGRYISSDEIAAAQVRLHELWKDADRWLSKHKK